MYETPSIDLHVTVNVAVSVDMNDRVELPQLALQARGTQYRIEKLVLNSYFSRLPCELENIHSPTVF